MFDGRHGYGDGVPSLYETHGDGFGSGDGLALASGDHYTLGVPRWWDSDMRMVTWEAGNDVDE